MDFRKATDDLFASVSHSDLARTLGVSIPAIRQARLSEGTRAHRSPPTHWKDAVLRLAEARLVAYRKLIDELRSDGIAPAETGRDLLPDGRKRTAKINDSERRERLPLTGSR